MRGFAHVDTWIFDLDNTLYPASCRLFDQIDRNMTAIVADALRMDAVEARKLQKELFHKHGTTLRGMMQEHAIDPHEFLKRAHDIDYTPVCTDPALNDALHALNGRKVVFTNGTTAHAQSVLKQLGVNHHFPDIFDIVDAEFVPKPKREPYDRFLERHAIRPETSAMFEDIARNLEHPHELGMTTVLVTSDDNADAAILNHDREAPYVHHVTSDLAGFLKSITVN
jgi:putative hydrolase of the HAD superfamily